MTDADAAPLHFSEKMFAASFQQSVKQFETKYQKHHANDAEELNHYDLFKKSKARVAMLNALNPQLVSGTTSVMDFSQIVYDRLSDETVEKDGETLFENTSSYERNFIAVNAFADLTTREFVSQHTGYQPNNVWSDLKHSRRALTEIRDVVGTFFASSNAMVSG